VKEARAAAVPMDEQRKHQLQIVAVICTAASLRSLQHPAVRMFIHALDEDYSDMSYASVRTHIDELDADITGAVDRVLVEQGPWSLTCDGATSREDLLSVVVAHNARGKRLLLSLVEAGGDARDASYLHRLLLSDVSRCKNAVFGSTLDNASVFEAAQGSVSDEMQRNRNPLPYTAIGCSCGHHYTGASCGHHYTGDHPMVVHPRRGTSRSRGGLFWVLGFAKHARRPSSIRRHAFSSHGLVGTVQRQLEYEKIGNRSSQPSIEPGILRKGLGELVQAMRSN